MSRRTVGEVTTVWLGRGDWSRRDTRQWVKRSGAARSAVAVIRQCRTAHLVIDTIVHSRADQISRRRHRECT